MNRRGFAAFAFVALPAFLGAMVSQGVPAAAASEMHAAVGLTGEVVDGRDTNPPVIIPSGLRPVSQARVSISNLGLSTTTDALGRFSFVQLPAKHPYSKINVQISARGFARWEIVGVVLRPGDGTELFAPLESRPVVTRFVPPEEQAAQPSVPGAPRDSPCSGYFSNTATPSTIRVGRSATGQVQIYDFNFYVKHVLPSEWVSTWHYNSLRAGAIAARDYAWYWVNYWRGGSYNGVCYDVNDTTQYQVFNPNVSATSTDNAVDFSWSWLVRKGGSIFQANYQATLTGNTNEACGAAANGGILSQWGSQNCALSGISWRQILWMYYYPNISIADSLLTGNWLLKNSNSSGNPDIQFSYGITGDIPVVGDWCGTGIKNPGVYRDGTWYLRCSTSGGAATYIFNYGNPGDTPVVGDWSGQGFDSIGVVQSNSAGGPGYGGATWKLRNSNSSGNPDFQFQYGNAGDPMVVGDWSGQINSITGLRFDTPGTIQNGNWKLRNQNSGGNPDISFAYGNPGDAAAVGDWGGGCSIGVGVVQAYQGNGSATWYLRDTPTAGPAHYVFAYGNPGDAFVVGDWTGQVNPYTYCDITTVGVGR